MTDEATQEVGWQNPSLGDDGLKVECWYQTNAAKSFGYQ